MTQLKARAPENLVSKADEAAKQADISRAELIRRAVKQKSNQLLSNADAEQPPEDKSPSYNYIREHADDINSLAVLSIHIDGIDEEVEYPVSPDVDVDWADKDVVGKTPAYRLPVVRAFLDAEWGDVGHVPDPALRGYLTDEFGVSRTTLYNDLARMPDAGCAYPNIAVDPAWNAEALRQDLLDDICRNTRRSREKFASEHSDVMSLLGETFKLDGDERLVFGETFGGIWYLSHGEWQEHLYSELNSVHRYLSEDGVSPNKRSKYEIVIDHLFDYLEGHEVLESEVAEMESELDV